MSEVEFIKQEPEFAAFLDGLPRPERCQVLIDSVPDPQDDTTII